MHDLQMTQSAPGSTVSRSCSLAVRLAWMSLALAVAIGLVSSSVQVVVDLLHDHRRIENTVQQVMRTLEEPAEQALYTVDRELARTVVNGLFKYGSVLSARVEDDYGEVFAARERPIEQSTWRSVLSLISVGRADFTMPIFSRGRSVGIVAVSVDLYAEMADFFGRALLVFVAGFVRNFVLSVCLILLYHTILVRPLSRLCQTLASIVPGGREANRISLPESHRDDEFGSLVKSTNHLLGRFEAELCKRQAVEAALLQHQNDLDRIIAERTAALERLVITDPLTGLLNRRGLVEAWHATREQAQRNGKVLGVFLLDIDHFKQINDRHGHETGDRVLQQVAKTVSGGIRAYDLCARWGGEEFLIILVNMNPERLSRIGTALRTALHNTSPDGIGQILTVSLGGTLVGAQDTLDLAVGRADMAMYAAKRAGRDAMRIFGEDLSPIAEEPGSAHPPQCR